MAPAEETRATEEEQAMLRQTNNDGLKFPSFPYNPYPIQIEFMDALYQSLNKGGIYMLESPTGTGKTLSIICSALQWIVDKKKNRDFEIEANSKPDLAPGGSDDEPDWVRNFSVESRDKVRKTKKELDFASAKLNRRKGVGNGRNPLIKCERGDDTGRTKIFENLKKKDDAVEMNDEDFLLEEYESEEEGTIFGSVGLKRKVGDLYDGSSTDDEGRDNSDVDDEEEEKLKVYFCSRTHSQLSQFVKELRRTNFADELNMVCLGSRKNFCINEEVLKLRTATRINERCLELQKKKKNEALKNKGTRAGERVRRTRVDSGCPMLRKHKLQKEFKNEIHLQGALDIEDLVRIGRRMGTCPYYGSRSMVPAADLVVLPYQSLLSKASRESLGLNLKDSVIIIDEAHNLADSLIRMHDVKITLPELECVHSHIEGYFKRFQNLLGPGNRRHIQILMVLTHAFLNVLRNKEQADHVGHGKVLGSDGTFDCSMAINDFLLSLNIDNINLVKLVEYIKESNIIHKVTGYGDKMFSLQKCSEPNNGGEISEEGSTLSCFQALVDMFSSLTNNDGDGRIIISRSRSGPTFSGQERGYLKFVMLTGERIFSEIVDQAHAVIMAGGTLQPVEETKERLFPHMTLDKSSFFSCGHIVSPESILPLAVPRGPSGVSFDFSYGSRSSSNVIKELGLLVCNLVAVVPEGIVVFFSSFDYEELVYSTWKQLGILERISKKKHVFREPQRNTDVEVILKEYKEMIESPAPYNGAILLAVVGGKISEGINFSDGMGRCVIMVGLPYPNPSDIELIERVKYIDSQGDKTLAKPQEGDEHYQGGIQAGFDVLRSCKKKGKDYYENLCMKAVNQSIGRAIRHINDYAAILLVDTRYASDPSRRIFSHPTDKLPNWIKSQLFTADSYGEVHRRLHQFFKFNRMR